MDNLIERLREFVVERGKVACGSDIVSACNNSALSLSDLRALLGALEAAREDAADAERYRWLRDEARTNRAPHIFQYPAQSFDHPQYPHFKDVGLDAAIDAAREARND